MKYHYSSDSNLQNPQKLFSTTNCLGHSRLQADKFPEEEIRFTFQRRQTVHSGSPVNLRNYRLFQNHQLFDGSCATFYQAQSQRRWGGHPFKIGINHLCEISSGFYVPLDGKRRMPATARTDRRTNRNHNTSGPIYTQGEVTSQSLRSRNARHFVGITPHNAFS